MIPGSSTPLTKGEKAHLSRLAQDAWSMLHRAGAIDEPLDEWRRNQALQAVGRRISEATKRDFSTLKSHFLAYAGKTRRALQEAMQDDDANARRQALWHLQKELTKRGLELSYAVAIAQDKYKTTQLTELTRKQIWSLVFDIRTSRHKPVA